MLIVTDPTDAAEQTVRDYLRLFDREPPAHQRIRYLVFGRQEYTPEQFAVLIRSRRAAVPREVVTEGELFG